jgi:hypothetical protein
MYKKYVLGIKKTEKADEMLHSLGLQLPQENTSTSSKNILSYSAQNVKYPENNDGVNSLSVRNKQRYSLILRFVFKYS